MTTKLRTLIVSAALLAAGCSGDNGTTNPALDDATTAPSVDVVEFTLTYAEADGLTPTDRVLTPGNRLIFRFIPGHIFGSTTSDVLIDAPVNDANRVEVNFSEGIFSELTRPETISMDAFNEGLIIEPMDVQFGRIGNFVVDSTGESVPTNSGYSLYDSRTDSAFILLYFDRAAEITGSRQRPDQISVFDIDIPTAGFYAVGVTETQNSDGFTTFQYNRIVDLQNEAFFYIEQ